MLVTINSSSETTFTPTSLSGRAGDSEASNPDENGNIYQPRVVGESLQPCRDGSHPERGDGFSRDVPWLQEQTLVPVLKQEKSSCDTARGGLEMLSPLHNPSEVASPSHPGWSGFQDPWFPSSLIPNNSFGLLPFNCCSYQ